MNTPRSVIVATGSCIPEVCIPNSDFLNSRFFEKEMMPIEKSSSAIIEKFKEITGIEKRRYAKPEQSASDLATLAAADALESSGIDKESIDYIIVAHNFGDISSGTHNPHLVPSLATRVKQQLEIMNPDCVAYDILFGCPGWIEGLIQANYYIMSGEAKRCMVIGTETLSRVIDPHDRDSMLYADGSGAVILESAVNSLKGILSHKTQTYAVEYGSLLHVGPSYDCTEKMAGSSFLKMNGRKLYEFALTHVPIVIKRALDKAGIHLGEVNKVLIHQANAKMDAAILERLFKLCGLEKPDAEEIMPMTISWLGNSSVATLPTLLDLILKKKIPHRIDVRDTILFASIGAGMNANALVYQF